MTLQHRGNTTTTSRKLGFDGAAMPRTILALTAFAVCAGQANALDINLGAGVSATDQTPWIQSGTDDQDKLEQSYVRADLTVDPTTHKVKIFDGHSPIFTNAWKNWQGLQGHAGWKRVDGGANKNGLLDGTMTVNEFKAFNYADNPPRGDLDGGLQIQVSFHPEGHDPASGTWAQGLLATLGTDDDSGSGDQTSYMDCNVAHPDNPPPLYPYSYHDGSFKDRPSRNDDFDKVVTWKAVCLIATADNEDRVLTTYQGFEYQFQIFSRPVPEPGSMAALGCGLVALVGRRRIRKTCKRDPDEGAGPRDANRRGTRLHAARALQLVFVIGLTGMAASASAQNEYWENKPFKFTFDNPWAPHQVHWKYLAHAQATGGGKTDAPKDETGDVVVEAPNSDVKRVHASEPGAHAKAKARYQIDKQDTDGFVSIQLPSGYR